MPDRPPSIAACYFGAEHWTRMARVLAYTARLHCPAWNIRIEDIQPSKRCSPLGVASHTANTQKLDWWAAVVARARDGDRLLLIDADTMVLRALDDVWALDFDLAYTSKPGRLPLNGGVVFVRVSSSTRAFVAEWQRTNLRLLRDPVAHKPWRRKYAGINQAAFGCLIESGLAERLGVRLLGLPCSEWNCEDSSWRRFDGAVRILHIKSALRHTVFRRAGAAGDLAPLARLWHQAERFARERGAA